MNKSTNILLYFTALCSNYIRHQTNKTMDIDPSRPWLTGDLVVRPDDDQSLEKFLIEFRRLLPINPMVGVFPHQCCAKLHLVEGKSFRLEWNEVADDPDIGFKSFLEGPSAVPRLPSASPPRITLTSSGVNGDVFKVRCGRNVNVLLKESKSKTSDNLFVEWFNGRGINYLRKRIPIFPQTYELLATDYNLPPAYTAVYTPHVPLVTLVQMIQGTDIAITSQFIDAEHTSLLELRRVIKEQSLASKTYMERTTQEHNILWSMYFLLSCLYNLRSELAHNDLHESNIMLIKLNRPIQVTFTNARGVTEQIKLALFPVIIDFGRSMVIETSHQIYTTDLYWIFRDLGYSEPEDETNGIYGCFNTFRSHLFIKHTLGQLGSDEFKHSIEPLIEKYKLVGQPDDEGQIYRLSDQLSSVASHIRQTTDYPTDLNLIEDSVKNPHLFREPDYDNLRGNASDSFLKQQRPMQPARMQPARPLSFFQLLNR